MNILMVGAGAIGCELQKNFSMMGVCTNQNSLLTVTDHDRIEKSNLNNAEFIFSHRQAILFRENDISKLKSECAINSIKLMNKNIRCKFMEEFVDSKIENIFNKEFFEKQSAVILAVDNFEARSYISEKCEIFKVPYFNCGTEGSYANVEAYILDLRIQLNTIKKIFKILKIACLQNFGDCVKCSIKSFKNYTSII